MAHLNRIYQWETTQPVTPWRHKLLGEQNFSTWTWWHYIFLTLITREGLGSQALFIFNNGPFIKITDAYYLTKKDKAKAPFASNIKLDKNPHIRDTWVPQWLSICLWLRVWSRGPGIESRIRFPVESLLVPLPVSASLSLCLSWINK